MTSSIHALPDLPSKGPKGRPSKRAKSIVQAARSNSEKELLLALRERIATAIDDVATPARDLASLSRRLMDISKELAAISEQEAGGGGVVELSADEPFSPETV